MRDAGNLAASHALVAKLLVRADEAGITEREAPSMHDLLWLVAQVAQLDLVALLEAAVTLLADEGAARRAAADPIWSLLANNLHAPRAVAHRRADRSACVHGMKKN